MLGASRPLDRCQDAVRVNLVFETGEECGRAGLCGRAALSV
jgi:hypothetical protein